jgi:hypothetical protein
MDSWREWIHSFRKYFNTAAFAQNQPGQFGNSGRDSIVGPNQFRAMEIRSEFFNALNHPTFGEFSNSASSSGSERGKGKTLGVHWFQ